MPPVRVSRKSSSDEFAHPLALEYEDNVRLEECKPVQIAEEGFEPPGLLPFVVQVL